MLQGLRSLLFVGQMYLMMALMGIVYLPWAIVSPRGARAACKHYCGWVRWTARWMVGLRTEIRGPVPSGEVLVASKHQSFLDIILIFHALPAAKFIMKRELIFAPVLGVYALRIGCVPVNRGKRGQAIAKMLADVEAGAADPGQLVIYPQGTRVPPGEPRPYKVGTALLYDQMQQPCVPAATNAGLFWPRKGIRRTPGCAVVEFLDPIQPGQSKDEMLHGLEARIEAASDALLAEAGFTTRT